MRFNTDTMQYKLTLLPQKNVYTFTLGMDILSILHNYGVSINSSCGGKGTCGKCKVIVLQGKYKTLSTQWVSKDEERKNVVLACKTYPREDVVVELPDAACTGKIVAAGVDIEVYSPSAKSVCSGFDGGVTPVIREVTVQLIPPTVEDNVSDYERLINGIKAVGITQKVVVPLRVLRSIGKVLRLANWKTTVTLAETGENGEEYEIVEIKPANSAGSKIYGIAVDIGTTTVVGVLHSLVDGKVLAVKALNNQQMMHGDDVISRIMYAENGEGKGLEVLAEKIRGTVNILITELTAVAGVIVEDIACMTAAGNTTMIQLFLAIPPGNIRREPYIPAVKKYPVLTAGELGLKLRPYARVYCLPSVASYVGGDIVSGVLASGMGKQKRVALLLDLGTNGEIVLGNNDWMLSCACSAGPAFEGVGIKNGIRAVEGAIENVIIDNTTYNAKVDTINKKTPRGICGTGLVELPAELLRAGIIDKSGKMDIKKPNVRESSDGSGWEYVIVYKNFSGTHDDIVITEADIANILRAKGAVFLGIQVLLKNTGLEFGDIEHVYISGGFGTMIDIEKAVELGLLPDLPRDRVEFIGNSSLTGAGMFLLSRQARSDACEVADKMAYIELSVDPMFMNEYTSTLFIPHTDITLFPSLKQRGGRNDESN